MAASPEHEQRLEQYVVGRGLTTEDELKEARRLLNQAEKEGRGMSLTEALVKAGGLTESQARRILALLAKEPSAPAPPPLGKRPPHRNSRSPASRFSRRSAAAARRSFSGAARSRSTASWPSR
ncbi:MAG: hypothetical protein NTU94_01515 [Planctomycetota bacterium]|nr:hypothetical protein [Planctomycetota bacterium]